VYLSGSLGTSPEWAGVGFIIAPSLQHHIVGFHPASNRVSSLKVKVSGGSIAVVCVYAPHNLKPLDERVAFYDVLETCVDKTKVYGSTFVFGDLNARIGQRRNDEEDILGEYCFGREARHATEVPNRDLLVEFCTSHGFFVANTLLPNLPHNLVTYHEPRVPPMSPISEAGFSTLDFALVPQNTIGQVLSLSSDRLATIASHHFPVTAVLGVATDKKQLGNSCRRTNWAALQNVPVRDEFLKCFRDSPTIVDTGPCIEDRWTNLSKTLLNAADKCVPNMPFQRKTPWITESTLELIRQRRAARCTANWELERSLRREVKKAARRDRAQWMEQLASKGDWNSLKKLRRKGPSSQQTRLQNLEGHVVSTEARATTLADHLETIQWRVRPVTLIPDAKPDIHGPLAVDEGEFTNKELRVAIQRLSSGKSVRKNDVPIEIFKAMALGEGSFLKDFLDLCNECWHSCSVPGEWMTARVVMIFKKGDPALADNYRPICLTAVAYRIYASLIKQRLLDAGLDQRLWTSQYGFRKGRSTEQAIYIARRHIELAIARRSGAVSLLALDWSKAFDSVHVDSLLDALRRFGIPRKIIAVIEGLMRDRRFFVEDCGEQSNLRRQLSGISQGCTLSPLLFIVVMSALMYDSVANLSEPARKAYESGDLADLAYADDTLLIGASSAHVTEFLSAVAQAGSLYGLELHAGKFQLLQVHTTSKIHSVDGCEVPTTDHLSYLGSNLACDGRATAELSRRIGMAKADFNTLSRVWKNSALTRTRKLAIYSSLVESKLLYSLSTATYTVAEIRRLDGFQAKCLRRILNIPSSYLSRISNETVRQRAGCRCFSQLLVDRQLMLLGTVLRSPEQSPLQTVSFTPGTLQPATSRYVRRVGRPRKEWVPTVLSSAYQLASQGQLLTTAGSEADWKQLVRSRRNA